MKRAFAFLLCLIGLLLPWRLRILYAKVLGYISQAVYWLANYLTQKIVKSLQSGKNNT